MAVEIRVRGAHEFAALSRRLKVAGRMDLRRELFRAANSATKPARREVQQDLPKYMPNRYARVLRRDLALRTSPRTGRDPGVVIRARGRRRRRMVAALERGELRHPLFGDRDQWYLQPIVPGFFTRPLHEKAPDAVREISRAMDRVANRIAHGVSL